MCVERTQSLMGLVAQWSVAKEGVVLRTYSV